MTEAELQLVREGLLLADDAMARLMDVKNEHVQHLANMLHGIIVFGELLMGAK